MTYEYVQWRLQTLLIQAKTVINKNTEWIAQNETHGQNLKTIY